MHDDYSENINCLDGICPDSDRWPSTFKNGTEVWKYLKARGYRVAKRTVLAHIKQKKLIYTPGRTVSQRIFTRAAVDDYARIHLAKAAPSSLDQAIAEGDLSRLQARKIIAETKRAEADAESKSMKVARERGELIPRAEFESLLAARWVVLRAGFRSMVDLNLDTWAAMIETDPVQGRVLMRDSLNAEFLVLLNEFARAPVFEIIAEDEPEVAKEVT